MTYNSGLAISAISDFAIVAGGAYLVAVQAAGSTGLPTIPVLITCAITGIVATFRGLKAAATVPPSTSIKETSPSGATRETTVTGAADAPKGPTTV